MPECGAKDEMTILDESRLGANPLIARYVTDEAYRAEQHAILLRNVHKTFENDPRIVLSK